MNSQTVVVDNYLSRFGLRGVHLMRMGAAVDVEAARARWVPGEAEEVTRIAYEEAALGAHHLVLCWPAREVVRLEREDRKTDAVMWWVGERSWLGEGKATLREAVDLAGSLFKLRLGRPPARAMVRKLPKGATPTLPVAGAGEVTLAEEEWVPAGYVVVE